MAGSGALQITNSSNSYLGGTTLDTFATNAGGLLGQYTNLGNGVSLNALNTDNFNLAPTVSRIDANVNNPNAAAFASNPGVNNTNVQVQWTGYINIVSGGTYTFQDSNDDTAQVYIDNTLVVNATAPARPTVVPATIILAPGLHTFKMYFVRRHAATCRPSSATRGRTRTTSWR